MSVSKTLREAALDSAGVPSESESLRTFRSVCSTEDGARWLEQAVDPMHDRGYRATGMPDARVGSSVVRTITKRFTLKAPVSGPYDALIHFTSDMNNSLMTPGQFRYDVPTPGTDTGGIPMSKQGAVTLRYGGVLVSAASTGTDLTFTNPQTCIAPFYEGSDPNSTSTNGNSSYPKGGYRLVAGSIEAYNTTPELYKSGAVIGYRLQNKEEFLQVGFLQNNSGSLSTPGPINLIPRGPQSPAAAVQLPGSVTHEAALGAYLPIQVNIDNPLNYARFAHNVYSSRDDVGFLTDTWVTQAISAATMNRFDSASNWDLPSSVNPCGLYFTGLSDQSTIDIVCRFVIEEFPAVTDLRMLTLANPSPPFDAEALKAYGLIRSELPIMVPVAWNGLGTWLKSAMRTAKKIAPIIKPIVMPMIRSAAKVVPGGQMAYDAAENAIKAGQEINSAIKQERKRKRDKKKAGQ